MTRRKDIQNHTGKKCGGNNKIPKDICEILERLEKLEFVKHINPGTFKNKNSTPKIDVVGYDDRTKKYAINVHGGKYVQKVFLDVPNPSSDYEKRIRNCVA